MWYDMANAEQRDRFKRRAIMYVKKGEGLVELNRPRPIRTIPQNNYLHLLLTYFAMQTGNELEYVKQQYFKLEANAKIFLVEVEDKLLGRVVKKLRSSAEVDSREMTIAIERFRNWSMQTAEIYLPAPHERGFLQEIDNESKLMSNEIYL